MIYLMTAQDIIVMNHFTNLDRNSYQLIHSQESHRCSFGSANMSQSCFL